MNLTEPQAGSDRNGAHARRAAGRRHLQGVRHQDLHHLRRARHGGQHRPPVLARTPDAPEGVKGISLFIVPVLGQRRRLAGRAQRRALRVDRAQVGIKASPTAVLQFGDHGGAIGTLVGEENRGLEYMFIMMNSARFSVGMQGVAVSSAPTSRRWPMRANAQSRPVDGSAREAVAIIHHPDVKRMLMTMRALTEGARALAYVAAAARTRRTSMRMPRQPRTVPLRIPRCRWSRAGAPSCRST